MTGAEIIEYIVSNNKLDEEFFTNGKYPGYISAEEIASRFDVGSTTIRAWCSQGLMEHFCKERDIYVRYDSKDPRTKGESDESNKDICNNGTNGGTNNKSIVCGGPYVERRSISVPGIGSVRIKLFGRRRDSAGKNSNGGSGKSDRTR